MTDHDELRAIRDTLVQILGEMRVANHVSMHALIRDAIDAEDVEMCKELVAHIDRIREEHEP